MKNTYELIRFCIVGGLTFVVDYGLLCFGTEYLRINYLYSAAAAFVIAVLLNYWLCLKYVFHGADKQGPRQQFLFFSSSIVGLVINQLVMYGLVDICSVHYMIAKIVSTFVVTAWNYVMKRKAVMKR